MSNFKFTPKKGVIANVKQFLNATSATAALTAANGLVAAQFINKSITDGLKMLDVAEEMAMANASNFFTKQLGKEITIQDIRDGNVTDLVEEANIPNRILAAKEGQYQIEKRKVKLQKKLNKLNKKLALLKGE